MAISVDPEIRKALIEDGVVKVPGLLDADLLARTRACYDWSLANPSPIAISGDEEGCIYRIDNNHPDALDVYRDTIVDLPFADLLKQAWDSEHIWYYAEETFWKKGNAPRTVWHQDLSYQPWYGEHIVNCWISFDAVPKSYSLEVIRSSHHGTLYDGSAFDPDDPTLPLWGDQWNLPRLPNIEADRSVDPMSWDVVSYDIEPGDVMLVHPGCLHGGAPVDDSYSERHTLVLRFFGDDTYWSDLPEDHSTLTDDQQKSSPDSAKRGKPGDPYRDDRFLQLY